MNNLNNSFTNDELRSMITGNSPVSNAYRELLARREAAEKPVAYIDNDELERLTDSDSGVVRTPNFGSGYQSATIPLFTAPPLPVVPDKEKLTHEVMASLLRECRFALDELLKKYPAFVGMVCGSTTLGNLRAELHDFRPAMLKGGNSPVTPDDVVMKRVKLPELFEDDRHAVTKAIRDAGGEVEIE